MHFEHQPVYKENQLLEYSLYTVKNTTCYSGQNTKIIDYFKIISIIFTKISPFREAFKGGIYAFFFG